MIKQTETNGYVTSEKEDVERAFFDYYKALFAFRETDLEKFKRDFIGALRRLDDETKEWLEQPFSAEEVKGAIENLNPGKSPGPGGLSAAFYKHLKSLISPVLADMYNQDYKIEELPPSFSTSHTILIPTTDDKQKFRDLKAWRPVSLTNADFKIL